MKSLSHLFCLGDIFDVNGQIMSLILKIIKLKGLKLPKMKIEKHVTPFIFQHGIYLSVEIWMSHCVMLWSCWIHTKILLHTYIQKLDTHRGQSFAKDNFFLSHNLPNISTTWILPEALFVISYLEQFWLNPFFFPLIIKKKSISQEGVFLYHNFAFTDNDLLSIIF